MSPFQRARIRRRCLLEAADDALTELDDRHEEIKDVAFTPDEGWSVLYGGNGFIRSGLSQAVEDALTELHDDGS